MPDPLLNTVIQGNKTLTTFIDLLTQSAKPKPKTFAEILITKQNKALDFAARESLLLQEGAQVPREELSTIAPSDPEIAQTMQRHKQRPKFKPLGPNVTIIPRRETKVDHEIEYGRWKVIKKELEKRGLPLYAHPKLLPAGETWRVADGRAVERQFEDLDSEDEGTAKARERKQFENIL